MRTMIQRSAITALLAAQVSCSGELDTVPLQEIRIEVGVTESVPSVALMVWRMNPAVLTREDGHIEAVLTDEYVRNSDESYIENDTCKTDSTGVTTCEECTTDATNKRTCQTVRRSSFVNLEVIDPLTAPQDPLRLHRIVRGVIIEQGSYTSLRLTAQSQPDKRDSYVLLDDGRECEVQLVGLDGASSITIPIQLRVGPREDWTITLRMDLPDQIDPSRCAEGYVVRAAPSTVEITRTPESELYHGPY